MERLQYKIESFLRTGQGDFENLALELFGYQFELNKPYHAYCQAQDLSPSSVRRWQDIPAVPIGAFKSAALATFPAGQAAALFQSSATTTGTPSRHYLKTLSYYEEALKYSFKRHVLDVTPAQAGIQDWAPASAGVTEKLPFLILTPPPAEAPHSSLTWMMDVVKRTWGAPRSTYFVQRGRLDEPRLSRLLRKAESAGEPVLLLGTTIAFLAFFDYAVKTGQTYRLAPKSRLMDTGGMKTQKRDVTRPEFVRQAGEIFGIEEEECINEYGMCELSSQFYGRGSSSYLEGPAWARTLVIDPMTGQPTQSGESGLLRHFDLANVDSVLAIQTEDIGVASPHPSPDGRGRSAAAGEAKGFLLLGRHPGADVKGCSLAAEAFLA